VKKLAPRQPSGLSPEILEALPEWVDPEEAAEWPRSQLNHVVHKWCNACHQYKLLTAFHLMRSNSDGRYPRCKACRRNERLRSLGRLPAED
jgi:hypothetical protein